jgi:hypothetical protein
MAGESTAGFFDRSVMRLEDRALLRMESPTPLNPLGVEGAAESGTGAPAAIVAASRRSAS